MILVATPFALVCVMLMHPFHHNQNVTPERKCACTSEVCRRISG